jgi:hypothetical protein
LLKKMNKREKNWWFFQLTRDGGGGHAIYGLDYKCSRSISHNAIHLDIVQNLKLTNFITIKFEELKN